MQSLNLNSQFQSKLEGSLTCFELDAELTGLIKAEAELRQSNALMVHKPWLRDRLLELQAKKVFERENQILRSGHLIYLNRGPQSVSRIGAGTQTTPQAPTYTTNQALEQPISTLVFPRIGAWEVSELSNGYQFSFGFRRPVASSPGVTVTELALKVVEGVNEANLARVVAPSGGLPHTFSSTEDTIIIWDLKVTV